jgi:uncharacterized protein YecE (DUF72 family)
MKQGARRRPSAANGVVTSAVAHVGCSGWQYKHWRGTFYPAELPQRHWFTYYAGKFDTVEINNTFYRLPAASTFTEWKRRAPPDFVYAVKASRFLTHMKKLKDPAEPLQRLLSRARRLGPSLGPILFQLPPSWPLNRERFRTFLDALPPRHRYVVEFRDPSWYADDVLDLLASHGVALCLHDMAGSASGRLSIGPFSYMRFHGVQKYSGTYPDSVLDDWADWFASSLASGRDVYAYFNNDVGGHAPRDAARLRARIDERLVSRARAVQ